MENDTPRRMPNVPPFVKFVCANVPMVFDDSLSYYEALCALWKYVQGMTDVINNNATLEEEYIEKFNELKSYVENYFANLDVQEEINNKLDQMTEDGTLADIVAAYIQLRGVLAYDTVDDMKNATNLVDGSFAETYGFYAKGDGGGAKYKIRTITNDDTIDDMFLFSIEGDPSNTLVAELIISENMNVLQFGVKNDGVTDVTSKLQTLIDDGIALYLKDGTYLVEGTLTGSITMIGESPKCVIYGGETQHNVINVGDSNDDEKVYLSTISFKKATVNLYHHTGATLDYASLATQSNIYAENLWFKDIDDSAQGTWWGTYIKTPKPDTYTRFESNAYACYPMEIVNNSGYNALMINNVCTDGSGTVQSVPDNSAIGIIDKVNSSAPTIFVDQVSGRHPFAIKNNNAASYSSKYSYRVFDINQFGNIGIGTSCDNDDATFTGSYNIKIKSSSPTIGMLRNSKVVLLMANSDDNLSITRGGFESAIFTKYGMKLQTVSSAYYLPNLTTDDEFSTVGSSWLGVMRYVEDTHKIAFWDGTNTWRDAMGTALKAFA